MRSQEFAVATSTSTAASRSPGGLEPGSPIENEIPTYRAISAMAVASVIFGLASALSFTSWAWLPASLFAVIFGVLAIRKIAKMPDVLTGRSLAQAGLAMGLVFGLTSVGYAVWARMTLYSDAQAFAVKFNESLISAQKTSPLETSDVVWYMIPSEGRRGLTPEDAKAQLSLMLKNSEKVKSIDDSIRAMIDQAKGVPMEFIRIEKALFHETTAYAAGIFRVGSGEQAKHEHKPGEAHDPDKERGLGFALISFKGTGARSNPNRWFVENIVYPYVPDTYVIATPAVEIDDGHGHGK